MKAETQLKICGYLLALLGLWSVTLTEYFSPIWSIAGACIIVAAWFFEGPRSHTGAYRRVWMTLGFCLLVFFPFDISLCGNLLEPAIHLSMFAQAYLLLNRKSAAAYRRIFLVSFMQILAATELSKGLAFAAIMLAYCFIVVYGVVLMQLTYGIRPKKEKTADEPVKWKVPRALAATSFLMVFVLMLFCLGFFYFAPRLRFALVAGSSRTEALSQVKSARTRTGFTKTVQLGSFGRIQEDQTLALRVEIPDDVEAVGRPLRWRGGALNIYDGTAWGSSRDEFAYFNSNQWKRGARNSGMIYSRKNDLFIVDDRYAHYDSVEQFDADPRLLKQIVFVEIPFADTVFGAGRIKAIQGPFKFGLGQDFNGSFFMQNRQALPELVAYTVYSEIDEPDPADLRKISSQSFERMLDNESYGDHVRMHFLQIPSSLNPQIGRLAHEVTKDATTPYDKVKAINDFLEQHYTYSLDTTAPATDDPLGHFLFVSKTGHCEYFATAMVMMARSIGIPARLARGFQKGYWNDGEKFFEVRQYDAHAWVEVFFPVYGWVSFDPSSRATADEYFQHRRSAIARAFSKKLMLLQIQWRRHIIGYNETRRLRLFAGMKNLFLHDVPNVGTRMLGGLVKRASNVGIVSWTCAGLAAVLVALSFLAYKRDFLPLGWSWSIRRSQRAANGTVFYERMLRLLAKRRIIKPVNATPNEFLDYPDLRKHPLFDDIAHLTSIYYRVRFRGDLIEQDEAAGIHTVLRRLRQSNGHLQGHELRK